jgi:hypothetical protein
LGRKASPIADVTSTAHRKMKWQYTRIIDSSAMWAIECENDECIKISDVAPEGIRPLRRRLPEG